MPAPLADQLRDYLTLPVPNRVPARSLSELSDTELDAIRAAVDEKRLMPAYGRTAPKPPKKADVPCSPAAGRPAAPKPRTGRPPNTVALTRILTIVPRRIAQAKTAAWINAQLDPPVYKIHATLSDMYKSGLLCRKPVPTAKSPERTQYAYWRP